MCTKAEPNDVTQTAVSTPDGRSFVVPHRRNPFSSVTLQFRLGARPSVLELYHVHIYLQSNGRRHWRKYEGQI